MLAQEDGDLVPRLVHEDDVRAAVVVQPGEREVAKAWYLERVSLLFAELKGRDPEYASWDY